MWVLEEHAVNGIVKFKSIWENALISQTLRFQNGDNNLLEGNNEGNGKNIFQSNKSFKRILVL